MWEEAVLKREIIYQHPWIPLESSHPKGDLKKLQVN
jgi:hypothetical protein